MPGSGVCSLVEGKGPSEAQEAPIEDAIRRRLRHSNPEFHSSTKAVQALILLLFHLQIKFVLPLDSPDIPMVGCFSG